MNKIIIGIYCIKNKLNNKCYIGQSNNIKRRWRRHLTTIKHKKLPIYLALDKYGIDNFEFTILEECKTEELNDKEGYWINLFNTMSPNGYNLTSGGGSGGTRSKDTRMKISIALTGENNPMYGKEFSTQHKERLSKSLKGRIVSEETKSKMSNAQRGENNYWFGKTVPDKTKRKISESTSGDKNGFYGKHHSEESKIKSGRSKMKGKKIKCSNGKIYLSIYEANTDTGTTSHGVCDVLHGRSKTTKGLKFYYEDLQ